MIGLPVLLGAIAEPLSRASSENTAPAPVFLETLITPPSMTLTRPEIESSQQATFKPDKPGLSTTQRDNLSTSREFDADRKNPAKESAAEPFSLLSLPTNPQMFPKEFTQSETLPSFNGFQEITQYTHLHTRGLFSYAFRLNSSAVSDDNLSLKKSNKQKDIQFGIGPSVQLQIGDTDSILRLRSHYAGASSWLSKTPQQRFFDQALGVGAEVGRGRLQVTLRSSYQSAKQSSRDAGARVGRKALSVGCTATYQISAKTSADISGDFTKTDYTALLNSEESRLQEYINYQYSPKLQFGVGSAQGVLSSKAGLEQNFLQGLFRIVATPTAKLGFNASAGNEWRQFASGQPSTTAPVFSLGGGWQPTAKTGFSVNINRHTFASASLVAEDYQSTAYSITAHESITQTLNASLTFGLEDAKYSASSPGVIADRNDRYSFTRLGINWAVRRWLNLGTFYEFSQNNSTGSQANPFSRNRIGISANVSF